MRYLATVVHERTDSDEVHESSDLTLASEGDYFPGPPMIPFSGEVVHMGLFRSGPVNTALR